MNYEKEILRRSVADGLGERLTLTEQRIYKQVYFAGDEGITTENLCKILRTNYCDFSFNNLRVFMYRIRNKLGEKSIIMDDGKYYNRRALIDDGYYSSYKRIERGELPIQFRRLYIELALKQPGFFKKIS